MVKSGNSAGLQRQMQIGEIGESPAPKFNTQLYHEAMCRNKIGTWYFLVGEGNSRLAPIPEKDQLHVVAAFKLTKLMTPTGVTTNQSGHNHNHLSI